jgi:DNA-binding NarL/FixJ family response regulator
MPEESDHGLSAATCASADRETISVLIIDDEPHVRQFLRTVLRAIGVEHVHEAVNGEEGVARYEELRPTMVLLDVNMPILDGEGTIPEILAVDPDAMIVIVTTDSRHETVRRFLDLGAAGYVLKHRAPEGVRQALAELIGRLVDDAEEVAS